jgi:hypothetical protein
VREGRFRTQELGCAYACAGACARARAREHSLEVQGPHPCVGCRV